MKLDYVKIVNFRSIKESTIKFAPNCRILVGINESGKSNVLKALSAMSEEYEHSNEDIREPLPDETTIVDTHIDFKFNLDSDEKEGIYKLIKAKVLTKNHKAPLLQKSKKNIDLEEFCKSKDSGVYHVDIREQDSSAQYWRLDDEYVALKNWKRPSDACPAEYTFEQASEKISPKNFRIFIL